MRTRILASTSPPSSPAPGPEVFNVQAPSASPAPRQMMPSTPLTAFPQAVNFGGNYMSITTGGTHTPFHVGGDYMHTLQAVNERIRQLEEENARLMLKQNPFQSIVPGAAALPPVLDPALLVPTPSLTTGPTPSGSALSPGFMAVPPFSSATLSPGFTAVPPFGSALSPMPPFGFASLTTPKPAPNRLTHSKVRFWRVEDWENWLRTSPEAQIEDHGKVTEIKACCRCGFFKLANRKAAVQNWGALDATHRALFHAYVERSYPIFRLAENGWKLDRLARAIYPAWRKFHLNDDLSRKTMDEKKNNLLKRKGTTESQPKSSHPAKYRRVGSQGDPKTYNDIGPTVTSNCKTTPAAKDKLSDGLYDDASPSIDPKTTSTAEDDPSAGLYDDGDPAVNPKVVPAPSNADPSAGLTGSSIDPKTTSTAEDDPSAGLYDDGDPAVNPKVVPAPSNADPSAGLTGSSIDPKTTPAAKDTSSNPSTGPAKDNVSTTRYTNPLSSLAQVAASLNITVPDKSNTTSMPDDKGSSNSKTSSASSAPLVAPHNAGKKTAKMRPGPVRNGRNLCAHRWLKQFKDTTNGTTAEFKIYYDSLSKEQREAYDKMAEDLVGRNAWNKDVFNGPML